MSLIIAGMEFTSYSIVASEPSIVDLLYSNCDLMVVDVSIIAYI